MAEADPPIVCPSRYDIGGDVLECDGTHFKGSILRPEDIVHSAEKYGARWTWKTSEQS